MKYSFDSKIHSIVCEPNCAEECFQSIWEIGADYDGCGNDIVGLHKLIDELVDIAIKGRDFLIDGKACLADIQEEENSSWDMAIAEKEVWEENYNGD